MTEYIRLMPISANVVGEVVTLIPIIGNPIAFRSSATSTATFSSKMISPGLRPSVRSLCIHAALRKPIC